MFSVDQLIAEFDRALRAVEGVARSSRPSPGESVPESELDAAERAQAAALMRVNHVGEVCAQALYQGQSLTARNEEAKRALLKAADEEEDHLAWSAQRVRELDGRLSLLNPVWYAGSFALGYLAGHLGEDWNLGFLAETERQVEQHLDRHLGRLEGHDTKTRAVIEAMRREEAEHRRTAE